jgi:hypothetical protein
LICDDDTGVATSPVGVVGPELPVAADPARFSSAPPPPQPEAPIKASRTTKADRRAVDTTTPRSLLSVSFSARLLSDVRINVLGDSG